MDEIWQIIVGLFFVGTGFSIAVGILADHRSAKRDAAWLQVQGKVLTSRVIDDGGGGYIADVKYEYADGDKRHTSDCINLGPRLPNKRFAKETAERYPAGSPVTVYHEPQEPSLSVLEREIQVGSDIFVLLFALVVFGVGTYVWLGLFRD